MIPSVINTHNVSDTCLTDLTVPAGYKRPAWQAGAVGAASGAAAAVSSLPAAAAGAPCAAVGWSLATVRCLVRSLDAWFL